MAWLKKSKIVLNAQTFGRIVQAAGLSRVLRHLMGGSYGILSASRGHLTPEQNAERTARLKEMLVALGYGFMPQLGVWEGVPEDSVFVPGISAEEVHNLAAEFEQDAYIVGDGPKAVLVTTATGERMDLGDVRQNFQFLGVGDEAQDAPAYTETKDRRRWRLRTPEPAPSESPEVIAEIDVVKGFKVITSEDEALRYGGMRVKNKAFALVTSYDLDRAGQPFFFLWAAHVPHASPRFGYAVHDEGDRVSLRYNDAGHGIPTRLLAAYLPLNRA